MYTVRITIADNKKRFVTLITSLEKYCMLAFSGLFSNDRFQSGKRQSLKKLKAIVNNNHPINHQQICSYVTKCNHEFSYDEI